MPALEWCDPGEDVCTIHPGRQPQHAVVPWRLAEASDRRCEAHDILDWGALYLKAVQVHVRRQSPELARAGSGLLDEQQPVSLVFHDVEQPSRGRVQPAEDSGLKCSARATPLESAHRGGGIC